MATGSAALGTEACGGALAVAVGAGTAVPACCAGFDLGAWPAQAASSKVTAIRETRETFMSARSRWWGHLEIQ
ncbi:hypothetical protein D3C81_2093480 [compost metagenome]